jgi:hypothetical protein
MTNGDIRRRLPPHSAPLPTKTITFLPPPKKINRRILIADGRRNKRPIKIPEITIKSEYSFFIGESRWLSYVMRLEELTSKKEPSSPPTDSS